ncbi:MAG TPA: hypothetical protein PK978_05600 [Paludibacter sp.]|nr:hypothetical protein [Paludibacter sp.]
MNSTPTIEKIQAFQDILSIDDQIEELNRSWSQLRDTLSGKVLKKEIERLKQEKIIIYQNSIINENTTT